MNFLDELKKQLPSKAEVTEIQLEGPKIVIYTKNPDFFSENSHFVKETVDKYKKRVEIRAHPEILLKQELAMKVIKEMIPKEAEIENIVFLTELSRVVIEAKKPGLVIGKNGKTLHELKKLIKWTPRVERAPVIHSQITDVIRKVLYNGVAERKKFLEQLGKKLPLKITGPKSSDDNKWIRVTSLGGFREIGRSSIFVQTPESRVLIDCGANVAIDGPNAYPYLNAPEFNLNDLDAVCITHAHLDHTGFLPYLFKYGYKGPVYCTAPTRDLMALLQLDYLDIAQREGKKVPYSKRDIEDVIKHTITLDWGEVTDITNDMRLTLYNSGHILGSSQVHLHIGEGLHNLIYTGDLKTSNTNLFQGATSEFMRLETLIIEATYGGKNDIQPPLKDAELHLISKIKETMARNGKTLIPVLAVGRAQEVMVVLEKYHKEKKLEDINVYLDGMIWDATAIHTAYPECLSNRLRQRIFHEDDNPFLSEIFTRIGSQTERQQLIESKEPAVILATSGMLAGGPSVEYFRNLAEDKKNQLLFVSYQGEGTLGGRIQRGKRTVTVENEKGKTEALEIKMGVETIEGFSGHSDRNGLMNFVGKLRPKPDKVLVCHGESNKCIDLASSIYKTYGIDTYAPKNLETIRLR